MASKDMTSFWLYRYRYIIGYSLLAIILAALLVFAGLFVPGGLSVFEKASLVISASIDWSHLDTLLIINLPYHLLQDASVALFGVSDFTIKLPSLVLGLLSALGLIVLLRRWFPPSISVLASLIAITTGQFLLIAQSGTPSILYIFWPLALLILGTQITRVKKARFLWKILFTIVVALSLYTPLSVYALIAVAVTIILHPHLRHAVRKIPLIRKVTMIAIGAVLVAPLIWAIVQNPHIAITLLGWPAEAPNILENAQLLATQYFLFWEPSATTVLTPIFGLGSALLIGLGLYRLIMTRDTTRSYLIISWVLILTPILLINPRFITIVFLPALLLLAAGLTSLIGYWYRLFPLNPYARIAGLIPIVVLVGALIGSGIDRYISGYHYSPTIASTYSRDLTLLPDDTTLLVVSDEEYDFYQAVAHYSDLSVTTEAPAASVQFAATRQAMPEVQNDEVTIERIITSSFTDEADRFYLYKPVGDDV